MTDITRVTPATINFDQPPPGMDGPDVVVIADGENGGPEIDPATGAVTIENEDGSVTIDFSPGRGGVDDDFHDENLAEKIDNAELSRIAEDLLRGYEADEQSRSEWLDMRAEGIRLLGLKLERPGQISDAAPLEGMSKVDHPLLLEAVLRFQANARGELLPSDGPIKVRDDSTEKSQSGGLPPDEDTRDELAEALEKDLNHYLTSTAKEYYPDTDRMLLYVGLGGAAFKKVYTCPLRRRPVSESVDAKDLIVSNAATDLANAGRITHRIMMRQSTLKRMQIVGAYRDLPSPAQPSPDANAVDRQIAETQGIIPTSQLPEDQDYTILEIYCELDIKGFEHTDSDGKETGLPIPYVVVVNKDSREVLAVRRNYDEGDDMALPNIPFVKYSFVPGLGFYDIGLVHILGNTTRALTAGWREGLDAGMFANFPGFLFLSSALRQKTTTFRVPPGSGAPVDSSATDIRQAIMPLPYKEMGPAMSALLDNIAQTGARVGGTAEIAVGEGRQDAPVGTTIALIEQATKILDAVHKRLHTAQCDEFQLLKNELRKDPSVLWRHKRSALAAHFGLPYGTQEALHDNSDEQVKALNDYNSVQVVKALNDYDLVPVADPNTPSHMHRIMKAVAIKQLQAANPVLYDGRKVDARILRMMGVDDPDGLFAPPAPQGAPGPTPDKLIDAQTKVADIHAKGQIEAMRAQQRQAADAARMADSAKQRESDEKLAVIDLARTLAVHPEAQSLVQRTVDSSGRVI